MHSEPTWVEHAIWYRIYPLGFTGAYPAPDAAQGTEHPDGHRLLRIIPWLDHIVELGCSGLALGPIFASASHGYDTIDHLRIDPRLGDEEDFSRLVEAALERGLRVQLDGVFNHVGRGHPLAVAALEAGPDSHAARWLRTTGAGSERRFVPFEGHDSLLTLNHEEGAVRELVVEIMRSWLDRGVSSWRLDAAYAVPSDFWADVLPQVRRTHPQAWFEAEVIHGDYATFVADSTADTVTQYELWKAIWSSINERNLYELDWALLRHNEMLDRFVPATFVGNHDVTRIASQIGDARHLHHAIVLLALVGGTPTIYAGDEHALRGVKEDRAGGDDAVRPTFPGTPEELPERDLRTYRLHQRMVGLRRRHPWLHRARTVRLELSNEHAVYESRADGQRLTLALNLGDEPRPCPAGHLLDSDEATRETEHRGERLVAAHGWAVTDPAVTVTWPGCTGQAYV